TSTDPTGGATYYLDSAAGSDENRGDSPAQAWRTLEQANSATLEPGDRLLLNRGGVWTGMLRLEDSGEPSDRIVVGEYGSGPAPVITAGDPQCLLAAGSYLTIRGLRLEGCSWAGVEITGDHVVVTDSVIMGNAAGIEVDWGSEHAAITDNRLIDNNKMSVLTPEPWDDSGAFGILLHGRHTEVAHNEISGSDAFSYDYGRDGSAIEVYGAQHSFVHHNLATENNGFLELGHPRSKDNRIAYNVVSSSTEEAEGIVTRGAQDGFGPVLRTIVDNNTIYLSGSGSQGFVCYAGCGTDIFTLRNNIVQAGLKVGYADGKFLDRHNVFFGGVREFQPDSSDIITDPRFRDPVTGDLRLLASSPAIDAGTALGYRADFAGDPVPADGNGDHVVAPDAGAYEHRG
ncbi:MAG: NosD domain-containing protein, partial [Stackebrandtia sp.]